MKKLASFLALLLLLFILFSFCIPVNSSPDYEDFTTYTEVDPNNHIALVGTDHIDFQGYRNEDCYLYKDKGVDYFGSNWVHSIDVRIASSDWYAVSECWMLSNDLDDMQGLILGTKTFLTIYFYEASVGVISIYLREQHAGGGYQDGYNGVENTWYYFTITKVGTDLTCKIYSDSERTSLLDTLSLTLQADHSFRYVFACNSYNVGSGQSNDLDIENLDLHIIPIFPLPYPFGITSSQANTSNTFYCNWTADPENYGENVKMSHWIFGSNISDSFTNNSIVSFFPDELLENSSTGGTNGFATLSTYHPSASSSASSTGQGINQTHSSTYNISRITLILKKSGVPNFNLTIGIFVANGSNPNSYPNTTWATIENSTKLNSTLLTTSPLAYNFTFSGQTQMTQYSYYHFQILAVDSVLLNINNNVKVQFNDPYAYPDPYSYGNEAVYVNEAWRNESDVWDMEFKLYGFYDYDQSWANLTETIPCAIGNNVSWQFWANNTENHWNTTGLQTFEIVGVNITLRYNLGGFLYVSINRNPYSIVANNTAAAYCQGSTIALLGVTENNTYRWDNFTWDAGNSVINNYNVSISLSVEGYTYHSYVSLFAVSVNENPRFFAAAIAGLFMGIPLILIVVAVIRKR